jgi:nucleotide-binding universal stress UspA family protein
MPRLPRPVTIGWQMGVILVATDGSAAATAALDAAIELARDGGHRLAVLTVWRALQGDFGLAYPSTAHLGDLLEAERSHAEATLTTALRRAADAGVDAVSRLDTGDPADRICAYARELDARMVAMGTHGYGGMMTLLVGSVSSEVIRKAGCPVLVVHDEHADEAAAAPAGSASAAPVA